MLLQPVAPGESDVFDRFVGGHLHGDPLQGTAFGDLQAAQGRAVHRFFLMEQGRPVGSLSLMARTVGRLGLLLYAPRGPVLEPGRRLAWRRLSQELRERFPQAFAFACAPRLDERNPRPPGYLSRGLLPVAPQFARQAVELPLSGDPDRDFGRMARRCRVQVRRASAHGIRVREAGVEGISAALGILPRRRAALWPLAATPAELGELIAAFAARGQARLFLAAAAGEDCAVSLALRLGRHGLCYHLADDGDSRRRAARYATQWAAIAWCAAQGADRCDVTGLSAPGDAGSQVLARRFGGLERRYALLEVPLRLAPYIGYRLLARGISGGADAPDLLARAR